MTTAKCGYKRHTPITSEAQRGFFGAELKRKREGKRGRTKMPQEELVSHLEEAGGKNLPARAKARSHAARKKRRGF